LDTPSSELGSKVIACPTILRGRCFAGNTLRKCPGFPLTVDLPPLAFYDALLFCFYPAKNKLDHWSKKQAAF
jgi:hypothetical protein